MFQATFTVTAARRAEKTQLAARAGWGYRGPMGAPAPTVTAIGGAQIVAALRQLGVEPSDTLFVHSDLRCALRIAGTSVEAKVDTLLDALVDAVVDGVLAMPTFSYSFCQGQDFDVDATPSTVGLLTERFRRRPGVRRTADPLFSAALLGAIPDPWSDLFEPGDSDAFGERSVFAFLRARRAKLAFVGASFEYCTYVHHVEQRLGAPYRYFKEFSGKVGGRAVTARYFVRRLDQDVETSLAGLADELVARGDVRRAALPGMSLMVADVTAVDRAAVEAVARNPDFLLARGRP